MSKAFGIVLRKHRLANELSQEALAEKAELHPTHISLIERFERNPSLDVAEALAKALGVRLSEMVSEAETIERRTSGT